MRLVMEQNAYIETAIEHAAISLLWQASDVTDDNGGRGFPQGEAPSELSEQVVSEVTYLTEAVRGFVRLNWSTLTDAGVSPEMCGHDFILTANRHGAGFWDRGLGDAGERLTDAAHGHSMDAEFALDDDGEVTWLMVENHVLVDTEGRAS